MSTSWKVGQSDRIGLIETIVLIHERDLSIKCSKESWQSVYKNPRDQTKDLIDH